MPDYSVLCQPREMSQVLQAALARHGLKCGAAFEYLGLVRQGVPYFVYICQTVQPCFSEEQFVGSICD